MWLLLCRAMLTTAWLCSSTCGGVCLRYRVYPVHGQQRVVLFLSLEREHHLGHSVGDPPPLQNHPRERVQGAELLQNVLKMSGKRPMKPSVPSCMLLHGWLCVCVRE